MLGLVRQNYQNNKRLFNKIKHQLILLLGQDAKIEHVGSTAIPNMSGKNIIDILIGAPNVKSLKTFSKKLEINNFYPSSKNEIDSGYLFFASSQSETKNGDIHIHLVFKYSQRYKDFLLLRNYLLSHPNKVKEYTKKKHIIAKKIKNEREDYKKLKNKYIYDLLILARREFDGKVS